MSTQLGILRGSAGEVQGRLSSYRLQTHPFLHERGEPAGTVLQSLTFALELDGKSKLALARKTSGQLATEQLVTAILDDLEFRGRVTLLDWQALVDLEGRVSGVRIEIHLEGCEA